MNKVILMGRLTRDHEVSRTAGGINFVRFTIAVNSWLQYCVRNSERRGQKRYIL